MEETRLHLNAKSGPRCCGYFNQGRGLSPLPQGKITTPNYSLKHARSGSDTSTASTYPFFIRPRRSRPLRSYLWVICMTFRGPQALNDTNVNQDLTEVLLCDHRPERVRSRKTWPWRNRLRLRSPWLGPLAPPQGEKSSDLRNPQRRRARVRLPDARPLSRRTSFRHSVSTCFPQLQRPDLQLQSAGLGFSPQRG